MNLNEAIETLKNLPADKQAKIIRLLEDETGSVDAKASEPYGWAESLLANATDLGRSDLSEHPSEFAAGE